MADKTASAELTARFAEELRADGDATLETARSHLRDLYERGPDDPAVDELAPLLAEVDELINTYEEHTPLTEFVQPTLP